MADTRSMANTIIELKQLLYKKGDTCINIPVIVRVKENNDFASIYGEKNLYTINRDKDIYSYKSITNQEITNEAKLFNHRYNLLYDVISGYKKDKNIVSSSASVLCLTGHKEDLLARKAALELARMLGHTVTVTVGLHIDDASAEAIAMLEANFQELLRQICLWAAA